MITPSAHSPEGPLEAMTMQQPTQNRLREAGVKLQNSLLEEGSENNRGEGFSNRQRLLKMNMNFPYIIIISYRNFAHEAIPDTRPDTNNTLP